jgi:3-oxoacyl-[acyl-carrier-protein] synthase II
MNLYPGTRHVRYSPDLPDGKCAEWKGFSIFLKEGIKEVKPTLALAVFSGSASCNIAIEFGLCGPTSANSDSCSSGAIAIGEAFRQIKSGQADLMLAGGVECPLSL